LTYHEVSIEGEEVSGNSEGLNEVEYKGLAAVSGDSARCAIVEDKLVRREGNRLPPNVLGETTKLLKDGRSSSGKKIEVGYRTFSTASTTTAASLC